MITGDFNIERHEVSDVFYERMIQKNKEFGPILDRLNREYEETLIPCLTKGNIGK